MTDRKALRDRLREPTNNKLSSSNMMSTKAKRFLIIMKNICIKRYSLTRTKLTALYKHMRFYDGKMGEYV